MSQSLNWSDQHRHDLGYLLLVVVLDGTTNFAKCLSIVSQDTLICPQITMYKVFDTWTLARARGQGPFLISPILFMSYSLFWCHLANNKMLPKHEPYELYGNRSSPITSHQLRSHT